MNTNESTILELEVQVSDIIKDIRQRITHVFDKYTAQGGKELPKLPDFNKLKDDKLRYSVSKELTECIDELNDIKLRVSIVQRSISDIQKVQGNRFTRADYNFIQSFRESLKKYNEELVDYKFDITDLQKNANNKLRVLESVSYMD